LRSLPPRAWAWAVAAVAALALAPRARADRWEPQDRHIERYNEGADALNAGDPVAAEQAFRKVLKRDPGCGIAALGLGIALHRQQRSAEAARALQDAAAAFPERAEILVALSEAFFGGQDFERARAAAEQAVEIAPRSFEGWLTLNNSLLRIGDLEAASAALERGRLYQGEARMDCLEVQVAAEAGDEPASIKLLLDSCQRVEDAALVGVARSALAQAGGDYADIAEAAVDLGADAVAEFARAAARYEAGDPAGAAALLDALLERRPSNVDARSLRATARFDAGDVAGCIEDLQHLAESAPWVDVAATGVVTGVVRKSGEQALLAKRVDAAAWLATLQLDAGREDLALQALDVAERGGAETPRLAWARAKMARARGADHWSPLAAGLVAHPGDELLLNLAGELMIGGDEAPASVRDAMAAASPSARYNLAAAYANGGDCAAAAPLAEALRGEEAVAEQAALLGYTCALRLDDLGAAESWSAGGDGPSASGDLTLHHAWLLQRAGRHEEALDRTASGRAGGGDADRAALLEVVSLCELGRLDAAIEASAGAGDPEALMWLASALLDAERGDEAAEALKRACPKLEGERAEECRGVLGQLREG